MKHDTNMWPWQSCKLDQYWDFLSFGKVVVQHNKLVKQIRFGEIIAFSLLKRMKGKSGLFF